MFTQISQNKISSNTVLQRNQASLAERDMHGISSSTKVMRNPTLDFTKGVLVLFMVLYHWINYFIGPQWAYYRYLRFLTPSFIFITGFMVSSVYLSKYDSSDPRLMKRLLTRGLKLLAIFIALNTARACLMLFSAPGNMSIGLLDFSNLFATFVTGTFTGKVVTFYILIPIAYLLILSGILVVLLRSFRYIFHVICGSLFAIVAISALSGWKSQHIELVAIGMLGIVIGFKPDVIIYKAFRYRYLLTSAYLLYVAVITRWNVPYLLEVIGTCLSVTLIYVLCTIFRQPNKIRDSVILLGKYSLFGYISQIVILQILHVCFKLSKLDNIALILSFPAAFALTMAAVEGVHYARSRVVSIDGAYRAVFN